MVLAVMKKIILAMVDNTGVRATGRYCDRLSQLAKTEIIPEASAAVWSDETPERLAQVKRHVETERLHHAWIGYFVLPDTRDVLEIARKKALDTANSPR